MSPCGSLVRSLVLMITVGEVEVYVDGKSVIRATGLILRESTASHVKGMHFQTFFGGAWASAKNRASLINAAPGHTPDWASPCDQRAWFASVTGGVVFPVATAGRDEL